MPCACCLKLRFMSCSYTRGGVPVRICSLLLSFRTFFSLFFFFRPSNSPIHNQRTKTHTNRNHIRSLKNACSYAQIWGTSKQPVLTGSNRMTTKECQDVIKKEAAGIILISQPFSFSEYQSNINSFLVLLISAIICFAVRVGWAKQTVRADRRENGFDTIPLTSGITPSFFLLFHATRPTNLSYEVTKISMPT